MSDSGLRLKPFATGVQRKSFTKSSPAFQGTGVDQMEFGEDKKREIEADRRKRRAELEAQYEAQRDQFDRTWEGIYRMEKKIETLTDKISKSVDPSKMTIEAGQISNLRNKINEMYYNSMNTISNALSTVFTKSVV